MSTRILIRACTAAVLSLAITGLAIAALKTDTANSSVAAVFKQMSVPVEGKFRKFNAQIDFNAVRLEASKAVIDIDIASFDLGDPEFNQEVLKKEWFNAAQFPTARFMSTGMKPAAGGKYDVAGKLTIKGTTADVVFPLNVKTDGRNQVFEGALPIKRRAFNIGEGEWKDTSMVADEVVIKFRVVATQ
jgi:polyisoprenoid-binding protein YceI